MHSIRLRVLGRAVVERDGSLIRGRAVQSHNLALLALLATSPGQTASRDRLISVLWPDRDAARARHRLSVALHAIRRELGPEALLSSGDSIALDPAAVWTDVGAFLEALDAGRLEQAVDICAGPFLDGFYLKGGGEFERWAESERTQLAGRCRAALTRLAEGAESRGNAPMAVEWRGRLAAAAPYDSSLALALMQALVAKGDVAGAIAHGRAYATRVEAELGIPVNPKVTELAEELATSAQHRRPEPQDIVWESIPPEEPDEQAEVEAEPVTVPSPGPGPWRRGLVAAGLVVTVLAAWFFAETRVSARGEGAPSAVVLPFEDLGAGEPMGDALASELGATLDIVPNLAVRHSLQLQGTASGEGQWRRVARDLRADKAITGTVRTDGYWAQATVQLRDVATGETEWEVTEEKALRSSGALVEALSMALADELRARLVPYVPHRYTDNASAYEEFLQGVYEHRKLDQERMWVALQHYRRAWEEDPTFALAHAIAGTAYMSMSQNLGLSPEVGWERGREHVVRGLEIDPTLPEGYSVLGRLQLYRDRDFKAAEATLRRAIMLYPTHPDARTWYAFYQLYYLGDFDGAVANMRLSLEVDPLNTGRSRDVETALFQSRRFSEVAAQDAHTRSLDRDVAKSLLNYRVANSYREMGMYREAIAAYEAEHEQRGGRLPAGLGITYARMGRMDDARAVLRGLEEAAGPGGPGGAGAAALYASLGQVDRAFEILERIVDTNPGGILWLSTNPTLDMLREDPRYAELLERLGLPVDGLSCSRMNSRSICLPTGNSYSLTLRNP